MKPSTGPYRIWLRSGIVAGALGITLGACSSSSSDTGNNSVGGGGPSGGSHSTAGAAGSGTSGSVGTAGSNSSAGNSSGTSGSGNGTSGSNGTSGNSNGTSGSGSSGAGGVPTAACPGLAFDTTVDAGAACTGTAVETEAVPVDLLLVMDRSTSMNYVDNQTTMLTRWQELKNAVQSFVQNPAVGDIGGGIVFFSKHAGLTNDTIDCNPDSYSTPAVPITPLATSGADLVTAIDNETPAGFTPILPAVQGALTYASSWATAHPGRITVLVLVTDGFPTQCGSNDPAEISAATQVGYMGNPSIRTYVIGVGDVAKFNLDNYANTGGTGKAYLTDQSDVSNTFATALLNITNTKLSCDYKIPAAPDMMKLDYTKVRVVYNPAVGAPQEIPTVGNYAQCGSSQNGGWYYDNPDMPSKITLCPCSCSNLAAGQLELEYGCNPRPALM